MFDLVVPPRKQAANDNWNGGWLVSNRVRTNAGVVIDEELALCYSAVFLCTRIICESIASLPISFIEFDETGNRKYSGDMAGVAELITYSPNSQMTSMPFREGRLAHQVNWGNGFAEIQKDGMGNPVALWPIHPSRVRPAASTSGFDYAIKNNDGSTTGLKRDDILHVCGTISDDGVWGRGIIQHAREAIGFGLGIERHGAAYFGSGAQPKGVVVTPGLKNREDRRQFRTEWKEIHASPDSTEVAILPVGSSYSPITVSNQDNQFLESRQYNRNDIANWYRVPQYMIGEKSHTTNVEAMGAEFIIYSLMPWVRRFEEQLNFKLVPRRFRQRYFFQHDFSALLKGDIQARMNAYRVAISTGVMTINQCRRMENMNDIGPDGDVNYLPANLVTAGWMAEHGSGGSGTPGSDHTGAPADNPLDHTPKANRQDARRQMQRLEDDLPERKGEWLEAARMSLKDVLKRMMTKESQAMLRAARKPDFISVATEFYAKHESLMEEALTPACRVMDVAGVKKNPKLLAAELKAKAMRTLTESYGRDSREVFEATLTAWPMDRVDQLISEVMR